MTIAEQYTLYIIQLKISLANLTLLHKHLGILDVLLRMSQNLYIVRVVNEVDWRLAELIVNIQYACQRHYFGAMAEAYFDNKLREASVNVQRKQKTFEAFERLPEEFSNDDVIRCFNLSSSSSARCKISRLIRDRLVEKIREERGNAPALYHKTGITIL